MFSRQAIWSTLAGAAILAGGLAHAQPAQGPAGTAQIIPVSLKNDQVVATVNGEKILVGDLRKLLDAKPYALTPTEAQKKEMRKAAVEYLVEDCLTRQFLAKNVPQVSQADFNKEYYDFLAELKARNKTIEQFYKENGMDEMILRRDIVAQLQWRVMLTRYFPDAKAKEYYDANKPFFDKVLVRASHILLKLPAKASEGQRNQALQQMQVWRQEIVSGKVTFEEIANKYSQCPSKDTKPKTRAETPGDVGQFPYKFVVWPEFAGAAFRLNVGEISQPVQTAAGIHLIKVTGRTKGEPSTFEALKDTVREMLAKEEDLSVRLIAQQRKTADIKILLQ